jgi:N-acetylmuramoyl-L-alanine amidase
MKTNTLLLFVSFIIVLTFPSYANNANNEVEKFVVVLDAGHGGKDPGNMGNGYKEKDIALKVVLAIGSALEKNPNIEVIYTRKTDKFIDLFVRGKIANKAKADLFVSVHCDSHTSQAFGAGTFVLGLHRNKTNFEVAKKENAVILLEDNYHQNYAGYDPNSPESAISIMMGMEDYLDQSIQLASLIQKNFVQSLKRKDRSVKQAGFIVLHQTVMPSVLVELGFLTNNREGAYLNSKKGQRDMAKAVTDAILEYKSSLEQNVVHSVFEDEDEVEEIVSSNDDIYTDVTFKVQIAASSKSLETKPYNFKGLDTISKEKVGSLYKYYYGATSNYSEAKRLVSEAKSKGYTSSYLVAFKHGRKISLTEALKR